MTTFADLVRARQGLPAFGMSWLVDVPRPDRPQALYRAFENGELTAQQVGFATAYLFAHGGGSNVPSALLAPAKWAEMFSAAGGFVAEGLVVETLRPRAPKTLFRGAGIGFEDGLSWTSELRLARQFAVAQKQRHGGETRVLVSEVQPSHFLGKTVGMGGVGGLTLLTEWFVDTRHIEFEQFEPFEVSSEAARGWMMGTFR